MDSYPLPRRIWRIIYPVLMFIGIQIVVGVVIELMTAVVFVEGVSEYGAFRSANPVREFISENTTVIILVCNVITFAVFLPVWLAARNNAQRYKNRDALSLGIVVAGFFAGFNVAQLLVFGLTDITRFFPAYEEVAQTLSGGPVLMQILAVGITAPVVEEMVFRGVIMNRMHWLPAWASVAIQAILFSVVHFNMFQSLYALAAGVLLGMVYLKYRSLILVIVGHVAFNMISVVLSEFLPEKLAVFVFLLCPFVMAGCGALLIMHPRARPAVRENGQEDCCPEGY